MSSDLDAHCPACVRLLTRVAELERRLAEGPGPVAPASLRAMRLRPDGWAEGWGLRPSPARRNWMTDYPTSYQCLPMVVANQWGWQVTCPTDVVASWDGSVEPGGLRVEVDAPWRSAVKSQFGDGIVTFSPPWLFRTPPGWDLYCKGPGNRWKPNCAPLEGVIETWWLNYTFTINWKVVEPGIVHFARGESLAQIFPVPHATFRDATAEEGPIGLMEPTAIPDLTRWIEERRRIAGTPASTHRLYLKAEDVEDRLDKVPVPAVVAFEPNPNEPNRIEDR